MEILKQLQKMFFAGKLNSVFRIRGPFRGIQYYVSAIIIIFMAACNNNITTPDRTNPTPLASGSLTPVKISDKFNSLPPTPIESIIPTPVPVDLSLLTFEVEIRFDATLPRIWVDDGDIKDSPAKYVLAGGTHIIQVFDLVTLCKPQGDIAKPRLIDKNQVIEFKEKRDCYYSS